VAIDTGSVAPPSPPPGGGDGGDGAEASTDEAPLPWTGWKVAVVVVVALDVGGLAGAVLGDRLGTPAADSVDVGFLQDMRSHHQQAVEIANLAAVAAGDPTVRDFAREVLVFQQYEVGYMEGLLEEWGHFPVDPTREAMVWMGMPTPVEQMPGMQPTERIDRLAASTGAEADALFLQMMTEHHRGGVHMASDAAQRAGDPRVRDLAERMARAQRAEIAEYRMLADRLGVEL
jgi:uncharacterized protein (DUF305 family)